MTQPSPAKVSFSPDAAVPFPKCLRYDAAAGFLVFLIALPLCLAIAKASGFPPIAGIVTAIVGGLIPPLISDSELTIKGPAAGLIAIVAGCVADMSKIDPDRGYQFTLAVGVVAAAIQVLFGLVRAGKLGDFFPTAAVHGLLASIGVMIMTRQFLLMLGVGSKLPVEPRELIADYFHHLPNWNSTIAIIGLSSLALLVAFPFLKFRALKAAPVQLIVLLVAVPLAYSLGLRQPTGDVVNAALPADKYLINVPSNFFWGAFAFPDFAALRHPVAWKWVLMFAVIASLESLLSAKAVDLLDPQRRKSDLNRDLLGCGVANFVSALIGGLPMISEIVRSRANVDNQAKTRWSNACHGLCLLLFAAAFPFLLTRIPIAALSAMLVFTGFRLAHPREFTRIWRIGKEQFFVFVGTIVAVVLTDLLIGVAIGVVLELAINILRGTPINRVFATEVEIREVDSTQVTMVPKHALVFSNWLPVRAKLDAQLAQGRSVAVDLSETRVVDHTAMVKLNEMVQATAAAEYRVTLIGLDEHQPVADTPTSARLRRAS